MALVWDSLSSMPLLTLPTMMSPAESLSWSLVFPEISTTTPLSGSAVPLAGLVRRSVSSRPGWLGMLLVPDHDLLLGSGWVDENMHSLLVSASMVSALVLLPCWLSGVFSDEWYHFLCLGLMVTIMNGCPTGVSAAGMSDIGRTGGGGVLVPCTRLLVDAGFWELLNSKVVLSTGTSALECTTVVSASLTQCTGPALELAVIERNQGGSLTELACLIWNSTSLKVVWICLVILTHWSSCSLVILVCWPSWFLENPSHFEEQFLLKLSIGLGGHLQLPKGSAEAYHLLSLRACISMRLGGDRGYQQWYREGQMMILI